MGKKEELLSPEEKILVAADRIKEELSSPGIISRIGKEIPADKVEEELSKPGVTSLLDKETINELETQKN